VKWEWKVIRVDGIVIAQGYECPDCKVILNPDSVDDHRCLPNRGPSVVTGDKTAKGIGKSIQVWSWTPLSSTAAETDNNGDQAGEENAAEKERLMDKSQDNDDSGSSACYPVGYGTPIDLNDKHGNPVHVGDTLMFDEDEWGSKFKPYVVKIEKGEIQLYGSPSDVPQFCEIVKRWDQIG